MILFTSSYEGFRVFVLLLILTLSNTTLNPKDVVSEKTLNERTQLKRKETKSLTVYNRHLADKFLAKN